MNEEELRDALHAAVDDVHAAPGARERLERRLTAGPARPVPRMVVAGLVVVVLAALVGGVLVAVRQPEPTTRRPVGPPAPTTPRRILAVTDRNQPVVLDARTGHVLVRYESHSVAAGTQLAVAPDGQSFYFVDGNGNEGCQDHAILRFGLVSGIAGRTVADRASEPAISPDGRWLGFYRCRPGDARPDELVVRDLRLGGDRVFTSPPGSWFGERLLFDADSRHALFELTGSDASVPLGMHRLDAVGDEAMPGQPFGINAAVLLGALESGVRYLTRFPHVEQEYKGVRSVGDLVGSVGPGATSSRRSDAFDGWFSLPSSVRTAVVDSTERHVVAVSRSTLYRWSRGEVSPTKLRDGIVAATWIPAAQAGTPSVAVLGLDGRLQVLLGPTSEVVREAGSFAGVSQIAAVPGGDGIVAGVDTAGRCGGSNEPRIDHLDVATGARLRVAAGRDAVVSRAGLVAYEIRCDGITLGTTDLATGANTRSNPLGDPSSATSARVRAVSPTAFSPDGTRLLYSVAVKGESDARWYVGRVRPRGFIDEIRRLPLGAQVVPTFLDDDHLAGAYLRFPFTVVRTITVSRDRRVGIRLGATTTKFRGVVTQLSADPSGRWLLAVLRGGSLVAWSRDDRRVGQVVGGAVSAVWMPPQM